MRDFWRKTIFLSSTCAVVDVDDESNGPKSHERRAQRWAQVSSPELEDAREAETKTETH